ncbi:TIGR04282 family arsenosugar biosynthesis glycosyltransferase [Congregibacter sp.]|uniref:TIGR04282 family arsenosugar biosynthesis glycosyltransferase n=1 Tax=Congregibacter sp. TaxID=2744308 RepID=UPI003F6ABC65
MAATRLMQQFARYPEPGKVKTRLQVELSALESCAVHEELLLRTANTLIQSKQGAAELWLDRLGEQATLSAAMRLGMRGPFLQAGQNLGDRMYAAILDGLSRAGEVLLVGSDCPPLSDDYLASAFSALQESDVVLGPAEDGGFVLIACRKVCEGMFDGVSWGGGGVLKATQTSLKQHGLSCALLPELYDVDTPADLQRWRAEQRSGVSGDR